VTVARAGIRYGMERSAAIEAEDPARAAALLAATKGLAYDLASFTWPGWGEEGIVIRPADREAGRKAALLNLELARKLEKGDSALSAAHWLLGAHLLAAGEHERALSAFLTARVHSVKAGASREATMLDGYLGLALILRGERRDGEQALRGVIRTLEGEGGEDADFYANQLRTAHRVFLGTADRDLRHLECGPLVLDVHVSRTAQLFHIVDQLSAWDPHCREEYRRRIPLTLADEKVLAPYALLRRARGWGGGLEQTLYTVWGLDEALFEGVRASRITGEEALLLRATLLHFAPRIDALLVLHREELAVFAASLEPERLATAAKTLGRFCGVEKLSVPCFLVAGPGRRFGGGYNGGRLVLEVPRGQDPRTVLLHEVAHAFFQTRREEIAKVAAKTTGLDEETLSEGLAYAFAQGLHHGGKSDPLARRVEEHRARGEGLDARRSGARFRIYALALRPVLAKSLESESLAEFLPRAAEVWRGLLAKETGESGGK
jgi:hypothetical protein